MAERPTTRGGEEGGLAANPGEVTTSAMPETVKALREERERRQRLQDAWRERGERLEAQRRAERLGLEMGEAHRRVERLELALWEARE